MIGDVDWAGVRFTAVFQHDAHFFRTPGLFAFVHRGAGEHRTLLFVDHSDNIAASLDGGHRLWADALRLGFNELNVATPVGERVDRLLLRAHIVRRCSPLLNVIESGSRQSQTQGADVGQRRRA